MYIERTFFKEEYDKTQTAIRRRDIEDIRFTLSADQKPWAEEWQSVYADTDLINGFCKERNIGFAVVVYPWGHQVNGFEWAEGRKWWNIPDNYTAPPDVSYMLEEEFRKRGIPVLNLFPTFRDYKGSELLYYVIDLHWTKEGNKLAAQCLYDFVKDKFLRKNR